MTFQERLKHKRDSVAENLPPRFAKILADDIQSVIDSGIVNNILKPGQTIPDIELIDQNGKTVNAQELLKDGPLVITFYRGFWCSFCNIDLGNLNKYVPEIEALGAKMITLSPEQAIYSKKIIALQKLDFDVLQDVRSNVAGEFGIKHYIHEPLKGFYQTTFNVNLKQYHGDDEWALPLPARFLVDQQGIVHYSEATADYRERPDPDDLIAALKKL